MARAKQGRGAFRFRSGQLVRLLPPRRRQRLRTTRFARLVQRLDGPAVALLVRMVVALRHRHRLVAGEVVDLLDGDAEVEHSCDEGMAYVMGPDMAEAGAVACRGKAFANRRVRVVAMDMIKGTMDKVARRKLVVTAAATCRCLLWPRRISLARRLGEYLIW